MKGSAIIPTARRYRGKRYFFFYALGKLALDPAYPFVQNALTDSTRPLLDVGCGMGLLAAYLRDSGHCQRIVGLDIDDEKVRFAQTVVNADNASFSTADALDMPEHSGDVVVLDVLHYFNDRDQQQLLEKIADRLAPGGTALIRVALRENSWRFTITKFEEWFVHFVRWIPVAGSNFPTRETVFEPFRRAGIEGHVQPMWGYTPFNSYLFTFRR
jgi:2-polyprenyl-3-methyl-5-hydroxy-6-metoxy-1,4-benzoquinol methylase